MKKTLTYGAILTALCISLAAAALMTGCSTVASALNIVNPRYSIREVRPRVSMALPLSASGIDIDFVIGVDNPNGVGINLDQLDFNLFVNETRVLDGVSSQNINIPARGRGDVRLTTRLGYSQLKGLWSEMVDVIQGNRARYEIRGNAYYGTPVGRLKFPVTVYTTGRNDTSR